MAAQNANLLTSELIGQSGSVPRSYFVPIGDFLYMFELRTCMRTVTFFRKVMLRETCIFVIESCSCCYLCLEHFEKEFIILYRRNEKNPATLP